ncbi:Eco57I restriction-modification methylase domain-containing protein, partial [Limosilactobacillus fermentum]
MKFDVVIGNPPYQDETKGDNDTFRAPIYNDFMDLSENLSNLVTLITPARFLFSAGSTPREWNKKMMNSHHFKIVEYFPDSSKVFPGIDIKGGVVITCYDSDNEIQSIDEKYSPAGIYIPFSELNSIMHKVVTDDFESFSKIVYPRTIYSFTQLMHDDHPDAASKLSKGHAFDVSSNIFDRLPELFFDEKPTDGEEYIQLVGRKKSSRISK